jgi:hypothetical protein
MMEQILSGQHAWRLRFKIATKTLIAWAAIGGGIIVLFGTWLPWFSLFAGLQPYRGVDLLNGRLLTGGGALSILAGFCFLRRGGARLRWGIGLLGFVLLAFASWSLFQLLILYRQLSADPMLVAKLGPGLIFITIGSFVVFATLFLNTE